LAILWNLTKTIWNSYIYRDFNWFILLDQDQQQISGPGVFECGFIVGFLYYVGSFLVLIFFQIRFEPSRELEIRKVYKYIYILFKVQHSDSSHKRMPTYWSSKELYYQFEKVNNLSNFVYQFRSPRIKN
jgi:hypothetical protein